MEPKVKPSEWKRAVEILAGKIQGPLRLALLLASLSTLPGCVTTTPEHAASQPNLEAMRVAPAANPTPLPPPGPQPVSQAPTGSLWSQASGSLYQDIKARQIGDLVTITVSEESRASKAATTTANKDKTMAGEFAFAGAGTGSNVSTPKGAAKFGPYEGSFSNGFKGNGATTKQDSMTAYMTATVVDVLPNGNLFIRGSRWTKVNNEMQQIILEGVIRPNDITRNNTVLSQNVAEAKIFFVGKGPVTQQQKPGWLGQILDVVSPF